MQRRRSKLPPETQRRLVEHFVAGTTARMAAELVGVHRNTARLYFHKLRETIARHIEGESPFSGPVEIDESYFGGRRKGKRGRGAAGKVPVFGILKRGGRVYTAVVSDLSSATLLPIIRRRIEPEAVVYTDGFRSCDRLDVAGFRHVRIDHQKEFVRRDGAHINGIENFWNQAKRHLRRFNGVPKTHFELFLKECEWRFNYGPPRKLLQTLLDWHKL